MQLPANLLRMPDVRQTYDYTCGPVSLQAAFGYYGEEHFERDLMEMCQSDPQEGTPPEKLAEVARKLGFQAEIRQNMTLADLEKFIGEGKPVLVAAQAWRNDDQLQTPWNKIWDSGHWMVTCGMDDKNVYFEDPSILGSLGQIPREEFLQRWHDIDLDKPFIQGGVIISGKDPEPPPLIMHVD